MKQRINLFLCVVCLLLTLQFPQPLLANQKSPKAEVTMTRFDQGAFDSQSSINLRNQSDETLTKIKFQLIYYDMNDNQIDYQDFTIRENIEPGMSRLFKIDAFQPYENYIYYRNKDYKPDNFNQFKVDFKLIEVEKREKGQKQSKLENDLSTTENNEFLVILGSMFAIGLGIFIIIAPFVVVKRMAINRYRDPAVYVLMSFLLSPFLIMLVLLIIGKYPFPRE